MNDKYKDLERLAMENRIDTVELIYHAKTGHIGGSMSAMDILTTLYFEVLDVEKIKRGAPDRDRFVLSKGHNAEGLYVVLSKCGFFPKSELKKYAALGTAYAAHPTKHVEGVEFATGSLGHGLSVGAGMALGLKSSGCDSHVYVLMGDGEQAEGSLWEAAMACAKYKLDNLTAIVDRNRLQISGNTEYVMPLDDLKKKYEAFGFNAIEVDGHNAEELAKALRTREKDKPTVVIANTVKGYGSVITENKAVWHHKVPTGDEYYEIVRELKERIAKTEERV